MGKKKDRSLEEIQVALDRAKEEKKILDLREDVLISKIKALTEELQATCTHPKDKIKTEHRYFGGSYYDRACTTYWNVCTCCGMKSDTWEEVHSYYG